MQEKITGESLKEGLNLYRSGTVSKKPLTPKTKKNRRLFGDSLVRFFDRNDWIFDEKIANAFIESKKEYDSQGKLLTKLSTTRTHIAQLRAFNEFLVERHYLTVNFCKWIAKPDETQTILTIPDIDDGTILKAIELGTKVTKGDRSRSKFIKGEGHDTLLFMFHTSRRSGEFVSLMAADIHMEAKKYTVRMKGGKRKTWPIPDNLIAMFDKRKDKTGRVFEVSAAATINYLRTGLRKVNITEEKINQVNNHTLRKLFARERSRNGETVQDIAKAMSDTVRTVEKYYLGDDEEALRKTVNNSRFASANTTDVIEQIRHFIKLKTQGDRRFNPIASQECLDLKKLLLKGGSEHG